MTLLELLNVTTDFFQRRGVESPRLNADLIVAHFLKLRRLDLYLQFDRPMSAQELDDLRPLVRRRGDRQPLQHILGQTEFFGLNFSSDARALVPRPETELLARESLAKMESETGILWDIGTGSGILALSLLAKRPGWRAVASDLSPDALELCRENSARLELSDRIELVLADLAAGIPGPFDLIVSNPPYLPSGILSSLAPEVGCDPTLALDGGSDGLDTIRALLPVAADRLKPGGWLLIEIGEDQGGVVPDLMTNVGLAAVQILPDLNSRPRIALGQKPIAASSQSD